MSVDPQALERAMRHYQAGNLQQAEPIYRAILQVDPYHVDALHFLGLIAYQYGNPQRAIDYIGQAVWLRPDFAEAHNNLAVVLQEQGRRDEAVASYQQAVRLKPDYADAYSNLGNVLKDLGRLEEAVASLQQTLSLRPDLAEAHNDLGNVFKEQGRLREAADCLRQALRLKPDYAEAHNNLGTVLKQQGQLEEALACYQQALRLKPAFAEAQRNLVNIYKEQGQLEKARACYQEALRLGPAPGLRLGEATLLPQIYTSTEEILAWRTQLQDNLAQLHREHVTVDLATERAQPLFYLAYQGFNDRDIQRALARLYVAPAAPSGQLPAGGRRGDSRIRVGFVSQHLRNHTIGELFRGLLANLARDEFAVSVLCLGRHRDATTQFLQAQVECYVELPYNLAVARQRIADQALDVLVYPDLGMDEYSYSLAFSRLAPVQCVSWGHPVTSGIPTIDYYLSSEFFETAEAQEHYTETLVRLPALPCYCYRVRPPAPLKGRDYFGLPEQGHIYACPQSLFKFHPEFDALLGAILRRDRHGLLVLNRVHDARYRHWEERLQQRFAITLGDVQDRIRFLPRLDRDDYLNLNAVADVMLDTIHFNGGNTSLQALALGLPIVTLPSPYLRGRLTLGFYRQMQFLECVAADAEQYVQLAVRIGTEPDYRAQLRAQIQQTNAVLYENRAGVRAIEEFLRHAVRQGDLGKAN